MKDHQRPRGPSWSRNSLVFFCSSVSVNRRRPGDSGSRVSPQRHRHLLVLSAAVDGNFFSQQPLGVRRPQQVVDQLMNNPGEAGASVHPPWLSSVSDSQPSQTLKLLNDENNNVRCKMLWDYHAGFSLQLQQREPFPLFSDLFLTTLV